MDWATVLRSGEFQTMTMNRFRVLGAFLMMSFAAVAPGADLTQAQIINATFHGCGNYTFEAEVKNTGKTTARFATTLTVWYSGKCTKREKTKQGTDSCEVYGPDQPSTHTPPAVSIAAGASNLIVVKLKKAPKRGEVKVLEQGRSSSITKLIPGLTCNP
jgi:hypothetical protein